MARGHCPDRPLQGPVNWPARWVQIPVESQMAGDSKPVPARRRVPDLAGLAAFTLDSRGRVTAWPVTAARLFGHPASAVTGQDVRDVLMAGPGPRGRGGEAAGARVARGPRLR